MNGEADIENLIIELNNNIKFFDILHDVLIDSNETSIGGTLILIINGKVKEMYKLQDTLYLMGNSLDVSNMDSKALLLKETLENTLKKCFDSLKRLIELDSINGGSLGFFLNYVLEHGSFNIGMVGITESKFQISIDSKGNLIQIQSLYPVSKETGELIEYEY